jgi:GntR family transcriptional regulator/MocR family aminotransferase
MSEGHFARHVSRMRGLYRLRRNALAEALTDAMSGALDIPLQDGGMHLVAHLRGELREAEILARLRAQGIGPSPLSRCAFEPGRLNGLMIGYANIAEGDAASAAERMARAIS